MKILLSFNLKWVVLFLLKMNNLFYLNQLSC